MVKKTKSANWQKWSQFPAVKKWQAVSLSLNIDPDQCDYSYNWKAEGNLNSEGQAFKDRLEIVEANGRDFEHASLSLYDAFESKISLRQFALWALDRGWEIPAELEAIAKKTKAEIETESVLLNWRSRQLWTLAEASYLLAGELPPAEPARTLFIVEPLKEEIFGKPAAIYADLKDAIDLKQLDFFPSRTQEISNRRVKPADCVSWAIDRGYKVPKVLADLHTGKKASNSDATDLDGKKLISSYKLILGLAVANYKYDPAESKSKVPGLIVKDLATIGIEITDDTVRTWLKDAAEHLEFSLVKRRGAP